jgi:hypothetical protein
VAKTCCRFFYGFVATMESSRLNTEVKGRIIYLCEGGMTPYEIATKLNIPRLIDCTILKSFQLCGTIVSPNLQVDLANCKCERRGKLVTL